jgi:hypothetical protein
MLHGFQDSCTCTVTQAQITSGIFLLSVCAHGWNEGMWVFFACPSVHPILLLRIKLAKVPVAQKTKPNMARVPTTCVHSPSLCRLCINLFLPYAL